jgi:hypothetical protein
MTLKGSRTVATGGVEKRAFGNPRSAPTHYASVDDVVDHARLRVLSLNSVYGYEQR